MKELRKKFCRIVYQKVYLLVILSKKDEKLSNTSSQYQDILVKRG